MLHLATHLSNLQRFVPRKPGETRYWRSGVGGRSDLQRNQRTLGENCVASCCRGVTLCNGSCKLLRLLRKVELDSTSCNVARNKKGCVASCRGTLLHRTILQQLATQRCCVASCCKIAQCNRASTIAHPLVPELHTQNDREKICITISRTLFGRLVALYHLSR